MEHVTPTEETAPARPGEPVRRIQLGDVSVTRVWEYFGPVDLTPATFFPDSPEDVWRGGASWLTPHFLDADTGIVNSAIQTWVLRSEGKTILIDTGVGNHKERPHSPVWHHLETDFLANLARAGVAPEDVDIVVNTHLHTDHVGWNTYLDDGEWVPTFPNATYLIPKDDFAFWDPRGGHTSRVGPGSANVFEDSVAPVHEAGQVLLWEEGHRIDGALRLDPAPGHTPGSSVLTLTSGTDRAVFVGDMLHTPVQILRPDCNSCFCEDAAGARATRRRVLGWAADHRALVVPAHLGGHGAVEVTHDGGTFAIKGWAPFTPFTEQR